MRRHLRTNLPANFHPALCAIYFWEKKLISSGGNVPIMADLRGWETAAQMK
jgi:hypothetical protein